MNATKVNIKDLEREDYIKKDCDFTFKLSKKLRKLPRTLDIVTLEEIPQYKNEPTP